MMGKEGISLTFTNPEFLRAYILESKRMRPATLAERISRIRETPLAEFPLDGDLFSSVLITLVVEPDLDPRGQRPTAIIRADLRLGSQESNMSKFHSNKVSAGETENPDHPFNNIQAAFANNPDAAESNIHFVWYGANTARISPPLDRETFPSQAVVLLQAWDPDTGANSISASLLSYSRYNDVWNRRYREKEARDKEYEQNGWALDGETPAEYADRWDFLNLPVGIACHDRPVFQKSLEAYTQAFPLILRAIYATEGFTMPNATLEITPPPIFKEEERVTFQDIGGHTQIKESLHLLAYHAKSGGTLSPIILAGPFGYGKTSLAKAFAAELGAVLVKKTSNNLPAEVTAASVKGLLQASYLEAQAAAKTRGGKAVLLLENLEFILGQDGRLHDYLLNEIDNWTANQSNEVIVIMTTNNIQGIYGGVIDRAHLIQVLPPDKQGIQEILQIHIDKITGQVGRNIFAGLNLDKIAERLRAGKISGRMIKKLLEGEYALSKEQGREITTKTFLALVDLVSPLQQKIGFQGT